MENIFRFNACDRRITTINSQSIDRYALKGYEPLASAIRRCTDCQSDAVITKEYEVPLFSTQSLPSRGSISRE